MSNLEANKTLIGFRRLKIFFILLAAIVFVLPLNAYSQEENADSEDYADPVQHIIDSVLSLISTTNSDSIKAIYYNNIAGITGSIDTVLKYSFLSLDLCKKPDSRLIALNNRFIAWAYYMLDETKTGLPYAENSTKLFESIKDSAGLIVNYRLMAKIYEDLNKADSIKYYLNKALEISIKTKDTAEITQCYKFLGIMHCNKGFYNESVNYYKKGIELDSLIGDALEYAYGYYRIGEVYTLTHNNISDTYKAKEYLTKSIQIQDSINSKESYYINNKYLAYSSLADVYISLAQNTGNDKYADSCYYYTNKTIDYFTKQGRTSNATVCGYTYVKYLKYYKRYSEALAFMKRLKQHFGDETNQYAFMEYYTCLKDIYICLDDYKNAYECFEKASKCRDEIVNDSVMFALADAKTDQAMMIERMDRENAEKLFAADKRRTRVVIISLWVGLGLVMVVVGLIIRVLIVKKRSNAELLQKNAALAEQKEEIRVQRDEIEEQRDTIKAQSDEIQASINYAQRIQNSLLTPADTIDAIFPDHFLLYKPRNIVSGDFYWAVKIGRYKALAVADCTGHGVPGALMSMLGISMLNDIIANIDMNSTELQASDVLNKLRANVINALRQEMSTDSSLDGIDMALILIDEERHLLQYSGACRPLIMIRDGNLTKIEPDRMPIGIHGRTAPFTNHTIETEKGDYFYAYSDGITDQFSNSADNQKFGRQRLYEMLLTNYQRPFNEQLQIFKSAFNQWKQSDAKLPPAAQTDDVLLVGIKIQF